MSQGSEMKISPCRVPLDRMIIDDGETGTKLNEAAPDQVVDGGLVLVVVIVEVLEDLEEGDAAQAVLPVVPPGHVVNAVLSGVTLQAQRHIKTINRATPLAYGLSAHIILYQLRSGKYYAGTSTMS
eukprot:scaffold268405_cov37-Prasinocladus_malaysianus.AAC.1